VIVYNLACDQNHPFEGWFGSVDDLVSQQARGLLSCPLCGSSVVQKMLSAPRLNLLSSKQRADGVSAEVSAEASRGVTAEPASTEAAQIANVPAPVRPQTMFAPQHAQLQELIREIVANTEDVGQNFPEEARRIHYKEAPERSIRGFASKKEAEALAEEGIAVAQLPFHVTPKNALN
jgi:hypothetical protein